MLRKDVPVLTPETERATKEQTRMAASQTLLYGWIVIAIVMVGMILVYGIRHSFAVFFSSILREFAWTRADISLMLSLNVLVYGILAPFAGFLPERVNPKGLMVLGVILLGGATASCSAVRELWHFYVLFGILMPLGSAFCGWPVLGPALMNWFISKRGLVVGLGQAGGGLSFAYGLFVEWSIHRFGWRYSFLILGGMLMAFLLPLYLFCFDYHPRSVGLKAYGSNERAENEHVLTKGNVAKCLEQHKYSLRRILLSPQAWLLMLSYALLWGMAVYIVIAHQVKFMEDIGFSSMFAVSISAFLGVTLAAGQLSGFVSDWLGREKTGTFASILCVGALFCLISVRDPSQSRFLYLYAICFGYGAGLFTPTLIAGAADIFAGQHFGAVAGLLLAGMGVGGLIGPFVGGYLFDVTGSYLPAFVLCIFCVMFSCVTFWIAGPRKGPIGARGAFGVTCR